MMQTTTLPIQISGAGSAPPRPNVQANQDAGQSFSQSFSQTFSQATQRQQAPQPAPAQGAKPASQQPQKQSGTPADKAQAARTGAEGSKTATTKADKPAADSAKAADADRDAAAAAEAAASAPVVDMLALVASLNQVAPAAAAPAETEAAPVADDALLPGAGAAVDQTLAALQAQLAPAGEAAPAEQDALLPDQAQGQGQRPGAQAGLGAAERPAAQAAALPLDDAQDAKADAAQPRFKLPEIPQAAQPQAAPAVAATQQTTLAQAVANVAGDKLSARVGTQEWDNQVGQKIVWMVAGKEQSASLTLNPPDLGPMQVVLNVTNDHADVTFSAAQPEVRQALEDAMPRLREMMSESGLSLGNASVNAGMPDQRQAQAGMNGNGNRGAGPDGQQAGGDGAGLDHGSAAALEERAAARSVRTGTVRSMVDTYI